MDLQPPFLIMQGPSMISKIMISSAGRGQRIIKAGQMVIVKRMPDLKLRQELAHMAVRRGQPRGQEQLRWIC